MAKRLIIWAIVGAAIGNAIASWFGPSVLNYWFKPPGVTEADRCVMQVDAAMHELVKLQLWGIGIGLALFLILGIFWYRRPGEHKPAKPAQPPAAR